MNPRILLTLICAAVAVARAADPAPADVAARAQSAAVQQAEPAAPGGAKGRKPRAAAPGTATPRAPKAQDRLELETTQITGNRELPKVMVIVPWKRSDIGDLAGRPVNSLVDEALQPVDREVFKREVTYFDALSPDRPRSETPVTGAKPVDAPEK